MNKSNNCLFQLTAKNVNQIRYIKLNKKASYQEKELDNVVYNKINSVDTPQSIQFYSFGFYDSLVCIKPLMNSSMVYKEHFLISYPFEKKANTLKVEQWFGILPLSERKRYFSGVGQNVNEPLFCDEDIQIELPFVGVILVSLSYVPFQGNKADFKQKLAEYVERIPTVFREFEKKNRYMAEIYYSLNCADLCIVIRTDALPFIHQTNRGLYREAHCNGYTINTTVIFAVQDNVEGEVLKKCTSKNKMVSFVVRSNEKYREKSKGVNGTGRYVTTFEYKEYAEFLPKLCRYKLNGEKTTDTIGRYVASICHEREWFGEESEQNSALPEQENRLQGAICKWIKELHDMLIEIEVKANQLFKVMYKYQEKFAQEYRLIKDLIYVYSDLCYQNASESGFTFLAQMVVVLQGITRMLDGIISLREDAFTTSVEELFTVMHYIACDLNGYNKQFQFFNQASVNLPSYEIQSKVNAEKYMAAYCSFLQRFFVLYYQEKEDTKRIVNNFPIALVDLNQRAITTTMFFTDLYMKNTKKENKDLRGMFVVHFPSSEYFSNVWNSIPLLLHEASHTQNYGIVEDRNNAIIYNIDQFFAELLAEQMLKSVNEGVMFFSSSFLVEGLREKIYHVITTCRNKFFGEASGFEEWTFKELTNNVEKFYLRIFDGYDNRKGLTYNQLKKLGERIEKDVDYIVQVIGLNIIYYPFAEKNNKFSAIEYFLNVLYLESHSKFLKKYRTKYEEKFFGMLKEDAAKGDEVEQVIKQYAVYRFVKCIQLEQDLDDLPNYVKKIEDDTSSYMIISLTITLMTGMWAIFKKYHDKFMGEVSEEDYYMELFREGRLGNISNFTRQLEKAYELFKEQICTNNKKGSTYNLNLMETMLYEYYELYQCINNVRIFLTKDTELEMDEEDDVSNAFIEEVYEVYKEYIRNQEDSKHFRVAFSKSNREQLAGLGLFEKDSSAIKKIFIKVFAENSDTFVKDKIRDRIILFNEVYADCGMCCAMGFDSFGYCMFTLSVHNIMSPTDYVTQGSDFLADRIRSVIGMYIGLAKEKSREYILNEFQRKLCDKEMIVSLGQFLQSVKDSEDVQKILKRSKEFEGSLKSNEILRFWKEEIIEKLISVIKENFGDDRIKDREIKDRLLVARTYLLCVCSVLRILIDEEILPHFAKDIFNGFFFKLKGCIEKGKAIIDVQNNACIREIRQFYNMEYPESEQNKFEWYYHMYSGGFVAQCNFVFDNYCNYRNAYNNLMGKVYIQENGEVNLGVWQWFEELDAYYQEESVK